MSKCSWGGGVTIKPDGINELDPCLYEKTEEYKNVTVIISRCVRCGTVLISWKWQENTECLYKKGEIENDE